MMRSGLTALAFAFLCSSGAAAEESLDCVGQPDQTAIGFTTICAGQETFTAEQLQGWSCENLWDLRSNILYTEGYCFQSERGKAAFDNTGCSAESLSAVQLNKHQRANVNLVQQLEQQSSCLAN